MYIQPGSVVKLLRGVPLDNTYKNTFYFPGRTMQTSTFEGFMKSGCEYTALSYVKNNAVRVPAAYDTICDCNYIMFRNSSYSPKWWYGFITGMEYINNETTEINFEIDVMQTWFFEIIRTPCYIEREHSTTDERGDNLVEDVSPGELVATDIENSGHFSNWAYVICTAYNAGGQAGGIVSGLYSGLDYVGSTIEFQEGLEALQNYIQSAITANQIDSIVNITIMPNDFFNNTKQTPGQTSPTTFTKQISVPSTVDGYTPKNKKLLTYPYTYLGVDTLEETGDFRFEYWKNPNGSLSDEAVFILTGITNATPEIMLVPIGYLQGDASFSMIVKDFPQVGISVDSFKAWVAQNALPTAVSVLGSLGTAVGSALTGNALGAVAGVGGLIQNATQIAQAAIAPDRANGRSSGGVRIAYGNKDIYFKTMQCRRDYAEIIDDYFTKYGYATKTIKTPNISARPCWNYVKTSGCLIRGNLPQDAKVQIQNIYDNGVTFWKTYNDVGNYSQDNSPD